MTPSPDAVEAAGLAAHNAWAKACGEPGVDSLEDESFDSYDSEYWRTQGRASLEAALPLIRAQIDREIAAKALRDAADEFWAPLPDGAGNGRAYNSHQVAGLLRARADRIERNPQ